VHFPEADLYLDSIDNPRVRATSSRVATRRRKLAEERRYKKRENAGDSPRAWRCEAPARGRNRSIVWSRRCSALKQSQSACGCLSYI
jgi:hypothetical protein